MKIFVIARGYPSQKDPTWGCFEKDQAEALYKLGHQVVVLSVDTRFRFYWRKLGIQHIKDNHLSAYNIFLFPYALLFFLPQRIKDYFYAWQLERVYKRAVSTYGTPDILYSHYLMCTRMAVHLRKKYALPLVAMEHWSALNIRPIPKAIRKLVENTYPYVDQLLAVSEPLKKNILDFQVPTTISVVHNMVGKEFHYTPTTNDDRPLTFVSTGRLVYGKGFDLLIRAFEKIRHQLPPKWKVMIIGGGEEKTALQQQINNLNLQENIQLVGQQNKTEIVQLLQQSDIFVFPSRGENFSVSVLEALACGLPVIASICGGIRECIDEKNGLLFPVDDVETLASSIIYMTKHLDQYHRESIAQDCQERFSSEVIAKQLTRIFEHTIKNTKENQ